MSEQVMLYVGGSTKSFRCYCGANVFATDDHQTYRCNGCLRVYEGATETHDARCLALDSDAEDWCDCGAALDGDR